MQSVIEMTQASSPIGGAAAPQMLFLTTDFVRVPETDFNHMLICINARLRSRVMISSVLFLFLEE